MFATVALLSLLPLFSSVAAVSPQSVESDLSIITHNDLYGNVTSTRKAAAIALASASAYSTATSRCAALGTAIWNPDNYKQDLGFLSYLSNGNVSGNSAYWITSNSTLQCRAISTQGDIKSYSCATELPALCSNTATDIVRPITVNTNNATITGSQETTVFRFLGLKFASIPKRFAPAVYLAPAPNTSALEYGPTCIQRGCTGCSEDCLFLNIWTPYLPNGKVTASKKKAVMLWIHGGAFTSGSGSDRTFDGSSLASRGDVVVVTVNYRLSTLGFLALENTTTTGNYGLRDQDTALDWIRAHIEDFGGDKDRVTIFGQSAGSSSVRALLASPQAQEKVAGAIMQSTPQGTGTSSGYWKYLTIAEATNNTRAIMNETGCLVPGEALVECLRQIDPLKLISLDTVAR
jgi:hypothetical protein